MSNFFRDIFDTSTLIPHGAALGWKSELVWVNAVGDALVAMAFFVTAFVLAYFAARRRRDMLPMFHRPLWAFTALFAACGLTRLLSILTFWVPLYRLEATVKVVLALISAGISAVMLVALPRIMVMPTRIQLQNAYQALAEETRLRRNAEAMVQRFQ